MKKKFVIRKVPLELLMNALDELWRQGIEFVDVEGTLAQDRDKLEFVVRDENSPLDFTSCRDYEKVIYLGP